MQTTTKKEKLEEKTKELKKEFNGLTKEQKELLLYRKIIETGKEIDSRDGFARLIYKDEMTTDELFCLVDAADLGFLKPLIVNAVRSETIKYHETYKKSLIHYNRVLENYKNLASDFKLNSSFEISQLFTYLLWNGYFSVTKKHLYKLRERLLLPGMFSFDVIKGGGVCLGYSELLHNYLDVCGKDSSILACEVPTKKGAVSCDYRPKIKRNSDDNLSSKISNDLLVLFFGGIIKIFGNHAITLISENGSMYAYDPTNIVALDILSSSKASIINGEGEFQIKPIETLITNPHSDPHRLYENLLSGNIQPAFTRKEFIFSFENLMELLNDNLALLDDAYDNIHKDLEFIDKQTNKIGRHYRSLKNDSLAK